MPALAAIVKFIQRGKLAGIPTASPAMSPSDDAPASPATHAPEHTDAFWMPFTANRAFRKSPRMVTGAEGMHYITADGRRVIDAAADKALVLLAAFSRQP